MRDAMLAKEGVSRGVSARLPWQCQAWSAVGNKAAHGTALPAAPVAYCGRPPAVTGRASGRARRITPRAMAIAGASVATCSRESEYRHNRSSGECCGRSTVWVTARRLQPPV